MKTFKLSDYTRGWIIGDFDPAIIKTNQFEVGVKSYQKGFKDKKHVHKVSDEITVVVSGRCLLNSTEYETGDVIWIEPGEYASFEALEDCMTTVIKIPSVKGDKYYK